MLRKEAYGTTPSKLRRLIEVLPRVATEDHEDALRWAYDFFSASDDFVRCAATDAVVALASPGNTAIIEAMCRMIRSGTVNKMISALDVLAGVCVNLQDERLQIKVEESIQ